MSRKITRTQTGVRIESSMLKVLKATAEYCDRSLGDLIEGIVVHAFDGRCAFGEETRAKIAQLKEVYGMDYGPEAAHRMIED